MRQLAAMTGISNPYLSQIENGLRDPSARVLAALADSLQVSVDDLKEASRMGQDGGACESAVVDAIKADSSLTAKQRQALIETYTAMVEATEHRRRPKK